MACLGGGLCSPSASGIVCNTQQTVYVTDIKTGEVNSFNIYRSALIAATIPNLMEICQQLLQL